MTTKQFGAMTVAASVALLTAGIAGAQTTTVTFDSGTEGWQGVSGSGGVGSFIQADGGNPGANWRTQFNDFGITLSSRADPFVQDYSQFSAVTLSMDVKVNSIFFFSREVSRPWLVELRDEDAAAAGFPWASVWFKFGDIASDTHGEWTTLSVTIDNPTSATLPAGWKGYGAEDPVTFEPTLPDGVTFAQILAGFDEIAFTSFEPGWFFGFTDFDIQVDNIRITAVPAPLSATALAGLGFMARRRRR